MSTEPPAVALSFNPHVVNYQRTIMCSMESERDRARRRREALASGLCSGKYRNGAGKLVRTFGGGVVKHRKPRRVLAFGSAITLKPKPRKPHAKRKTSRKPNSKRGHRRAKSGSDALGPFEIQGKEISPSQSPRDAFHERSSNSGGAQPAIEVRISTRRGQRPHTANGRVNHHVTPTEATTSPAKPGYMRQSTRGSYAKATRHATRSAKHRTASTRNRNWTQSHNGGVGVKQPILVPSYAKVNLVIRPTKPRPQRRQSR